jgi:hypothetical protein
MNTTSTSWQAIIRFALSAFGAWLIGRNLGTVTIDPSTSQEIIGAIMILGSIVWDVINKTLTEEKLEGALRQVLIGAGGIFVAAGLLRSAYLTTALGALPMIVSLIWSFTTRSKAAKLQVGQAQPSQLKR